MPDKLFLVTGACGFVGLHMVEFLISKGCSIRATDLEVKSHVIKRVEVEFIKADLTRK